MEEERADKMENEIEEIKGSIAKLTEMMQALLTKEKPTPTVEEPIVVEARRPGAFWAEFGPQGFGPTTGRALEGGPSINATVKEPRPKDDGPPPLVEDDPQYMFYTSDNEERGAIETGLGSEQLQTLEKRLRAIEGNDIFGASAMDMCLVPELVLPSKFKTPDFEKYKGHTCPKSHLMMYFRKMSAYARSDKLLIHCFQDSLSGASLKWYMSLDKAHIQSWVDLADAFMKQYKYNLDMAPDRRQLQAMSKKERESFKEYAQRWRETAAQVEPPISGKELTSMFMDTLPPVYWERMLGGVTSSFADLVTIGGLVEEGLKNGKIHHKESHPVAPRNFSHKKKEGETSAVFGKFESPRQVGGNSQNYVANVAPIINPQRANNPIQNQQWAPAPRANNFSVKEKVRFDPIPMQYSKLYPSLIQRGLVVPKGYPTPPPNPLPAWYNSAKHCEFHEGAPDHDLDNCFALKLRVQELIKSDILSFKDTNPNVKTNPMPNHAGPSINMLEGEELIMKHDLNDPNFPLKPLYARLVKSSPWKNSEEDATVEQMKSDIQHLLDGGWLHIHQALSKSEVCVIEPYFKEPREKLQVAFDREEEQPTPRIADPRRSSYLFARTNMVKVKYEPIVMKDWRPRSPFQAMTTVKNITGPSRMTRSGRLYGAVPPPTVNPQPTQVMPTSPSIPPEEVISQDNTDEFLKLIKRSDYRVVDQLHQTPSKISILSLLINSEAHRTALMKVLKQAHVGQDITVNQFDGIVNNITSCRNLSFSDEDLTNEGRNHNKALHISVKCGVDNTARVLVDTGSSLNVMPKITLNKLSFEGTLKPSALVVKAFDGSRRSVVGEVELPIKIGPQVFQILFQVMDINPAHSCFLGRPWIHASGAVTSTLNQKLKFASQDCMITVNGEEDMLISHLTSFRYIEASEESIEIPFQALEIANAVHVGKKVPISADNPSFVSLKSAKLSLQDGKLDTWGNLVHVIEKKDKCGLGYILSQSKKESVPTKGVGRLEEVFRSGGISNDNSVNAIEEISAVKAEDFVKNNALEEELANWSEEEIPVVCFLSK